MKTKILFPIAALFVLISLYACEDLFGPKAEPTLPEITTKGLGTFGCYLNGELWLPEGRNQWYPNPYAKYTELSGGLRIEAFSNINKSESLRVAIDINEGEGVYELIKSSFSISLNNCDTYFIDTLMTYNVEILKLDIEQDIISGTFEGLYRNECDSTDIINITEGRFDLIYY